MLEIVAIIGLYQYLKGKLEKKGRSTALAWLGPGLWLAGEFAAGFIAGVVVAVQEQDLGMGVYLFALVGAVTGAAVAFGIVAALKPLEYRCPSCSTSFIPRTDPRGETTCPECGTSLLVTGENAYQLQQPPDTPTL